MCHRDPRPAPTPCSACSPCDRGAPTSSPSRRRAACATPTREPRATSTRRPNGSCGSAGRRPTPSTTGADSAPSTRSPTAGAGAARLVRDTNTEPPARLRSAAATAVRRPDRQGHHRRVAGETADGARRLFDDAVERLLRPYVTDDSAPFPERRHIAALVAAFVADYLHLIERWSEFARDEIRELASHRRTRHDRPHPRDPRHRARRQEHPRARQLIGREHSPMGGSAEGDPSDVCDGYA